MDFLGERMAMSLRGKHQPQRTCVGCGEVQSKQTLIRIVRTQQGIRIDQTGKLPGRGAYLHAQRACWEKGLVKALSRSLRTSLTTDDRERLQTFMLTLTE